MQIRLALTYFFDDRRFLHKVALGPFLVLVPILNFAVIGYMLQTARHVADDREEPLSDWHDLSNLFLDGLRPALACYLYLSPFLAFVCLAMALPLLFLFVGVTEETFIRWALTSVVIYAAAFSIALPFLIAFGLVYPGMMVQYLAEGTFAACFRIRAITRFALDNLSDYLTAWGVMQALGVVLGVLIAPATLLAFVPCLGPIMLVTVEAILAFLLIPVMAHLIGQLVRQDRARRSTLEMAPPIP
jgi:hypothetical protein